MRITSDDGQQVILRYEVFLKSGLRKGDEIDENSVSSLIEKNKFFWAKEAAMRLLARRTHSEFELRRKLAQKKYEKDTIDRIISDLKEYNYLDDARFAREFYEEKVNRKSLGINKVKLELKAKGISKEILEELLLENAGLDQSRQALDIARKKLVSLNKRNYDARKTRQSLYSYLIGKGFGFELSKQVTDKLLSAQSDDFEDAD